MCQWIDGEKEVPNKLGTRYFTKVYWSDGDISKHILTFESLNGRRVFTDAILVYSNLRGVRIEWLKEKENE